MGNNKLKKIEYKISSNFKSHFIKPFAKKRTYNPRDNHYIFADPRGGSTWLMEIIQSITNEPVIWEPLDLNKKYSPFNTINFDWRQYIPSDENWQEARDIFGLLFQGKIFKKNILDYSTFSQLQNSNTLLFKFCRGSALLPWLVENFEFKYKPLYMIRHPFAVASSQLRHGAWNHLIQKFEIPDTPFNKHYKKHEDFLKSLSSNEEVLVAKWCLHNVNTLGHKNNNRKWTTMTYEDFVDDPKKQTLRILKVWNIDYDISNINLKKTSVTTHKDSPKLNKKKVSHWQNTFDEHQIDKMQKVLEYFKIKTYSSDSPYPIKI